MRNKIAIKNSSIGIISQIVTMCCSFITRRFFVQYLGMEVLGVNGVISNILSMLQLTELGIGVAIIYALYQPIVDKDERTIAALMNLYKRFYNIIAIVVLSLGVFISFFLKYFITTELSMSYVRIIFYIQLAGTLVTYLLAYRRNLMYADQRQYVCTLIDMFINIVGSVFRIIILIVTQNYLLYLGISLIQNLMSNILISIKCYKDYPFLKKYKNEKYDKTSELLKDVKDLFFSKIGGFIYSSTDNILISKFVGVLSVGLLSNYSLLTSSCKTVINSLTSALQPIMGNYVRIQTDKKEIKKIFYVNTLVRFLIVNVCVVGIIVLADDVVGIWLGKDDIFMGVSVPILLCIDLYIHNVHGPVVELLSVLGYFNFDKKITFMGVIINLGISIIMLQFWGVQGVLFGTAIAQIYYWSVRGWKLFKDYFQAAAWRYVFRNLCYIVLTAFQVIFAFWVKGMIVNKICIANFVIMGCIIVLICGLCDLVILFMTDEGKYLLGVAKNLLKKRNF